MASTFPLYSNNAVAPAMPVQPAAANWGPPPGFERSYDEVTTTRTRFRVVAGQYQRHVTSDTLRTFPDDDGEPFQTLVDENGRTTYEHVPRSANNGITPGAAALQRQETLIDPQPAAIIHHAVNPQAAPATQPAVAIENAVLSQHAIATQHTVAPHAVAPHAVTPHAVAPHAVAPHAVAREHGITPPHAQAPQHVRVPQDPPAAMLRIPAAVAGRDEDDAMVISQPTTPIPPLRITDRQEVDRFIRYGAACQFVADTRMGINFRIATAANQDPPVDDPPPPAYTRGAGPSANAAAPSDPHDIARRRNERRARSMQLTARRTSAAAAASNSRRTSGTASSSRRAATPGPMAQQPIEYIIVDD